MSVGWQAEADTGMDAWGEAFVLPPQAGIALRREAGPVRLRTSGAARG
jgi:hypothetical protein